MAGPAEQDKQALVAELAAARTRLSMTGDALRRSLDLPARAKESFKRHRPTWLSGAAIVGFVLSKLPARSKTVFVERATGKALGVAGKVGALFSAAKFAMKFAGPVIADFAGGSIAEILKRFQRTAKPPDPTNPGTAGKP
jgi:hypothetical protein